MPEIDEEFGTAVEIPEPLVDLVKDEEVRAYLNDRTLTLHFPTIFNNQDLTVVYDRIFNCFGTGAASLTETNKRIVQISSDSIEGLDH